MNKNNTLEDKGSKEPGDNNESTITNPLVNEDVVLPERVSASEGCVQMDDSCTHPSLTKERLGGCSFRWADIEEDDDF